MVVVGEHDNWLSARPGVPITVDLVSKLHELSGPAYTEIPHMATKGQTDFSSIVARAKGTKRKKLPAT